MTRFEKKYSRLIDQLLDLQEGCAKVGVPEAWVNPLFDKAHTKIGQLRPIDEIYEIAEKIIKIRDGFTK